MSGTWGQKVEQKILEARFRPVPNENLLVLGSVCLRHVYPQVTTRKPLKEFSWKIYFTAISHAVTTNTYTCRTQSGYRLQLKGPPSGLWQKTMQIKLHTFRKRKNSPPFFIITYIWNSFHKYVIIYIYIWNSFHIYVTADAHFWKPPLWSISKN
jgi:hypothetical protein